jgi:hypothetical protein
VLSGDLCFLNFGPGDRSFLIALEKRTGRTVWQYDFPPISPDPKWQNSGVEAKFDQPGAPKLSEIAGSWATPLMVEMRCARFV